MLNLIAALLKIAQKESNREKISSVSFNHDDLHKDGQRLKSMSSSCQVMVICLIQARWIPGLSWIIINLGKGLFAHL